MKVKKEGLVMNVKEVDFEQLVHRIKQNEVLSNRDIEIVNNILFQSMSEESSVGDIIFVPGNPACLEDRIVKAVSLLKKGNAEYIVLSGGVMIPNSIHTEAEAMYRYCIDMGIKKEKIVVENLSTTTIENVVFCAPLIANLNIENPRVIVVSSATHIRRVLMNFQKYCELYPEGITISASQSIHPSCNPKTWFEFSEARDVVATELALIDRYISKDGYSSFEI